MKRSKTLYMGIDPGLKGAIAVIDEDMKIIGVWDCPKTQTKTGRTKVVGLQRVKEIVERVDPVGISKILGDNRKVLCTIEHSQAMPEQGIASTFNYGEGYGMYLGALSSLSITYIEVRSNYWKPKFGLSGDKQLSLDMSLELFKGAEKYVYRQKDDGRAEALLLAYYGLRHREKFSELRK